MRNFVKNQIGITLIALVVTIIVLIILAGVSIAMLVGKNGIITQAQRAERETANATITSEEQMNALVEEMNGYLTGNGEVSGVFSDVVTSSNYGDYVDYPIDLNNNGNTKDDWRIFYNDGENVFIIAADYVESNSTFLDLATAEMYAYANTDSSYIYSVNWYNNGTLLSNHTGNGYINSSIADLFRYNRYYTTYPSSTNINAQATASLLDTVAWDGFVNSTYADYAIGGPTLEMWVASYNAKGYTPLYTNINESGYYIGLNGETEEDYQWIIEGTEGIEISGYNDKLYFPYQEKVNNCKGYWLASPSSISYLDYLMSIAYQGALVGNDHYSNYLSVRPLVSIKHNITATKTDNVWTLSN